MPHAVTLGPLLLPMHLLLVFAACALALAVAAWRGKRAGLKVEDDLWLAVLVGLLAARLAFVYEYRTLYFAAPLTILDIRDGGWNAPVGLAGAWLMALGRWRRRPGILRPLRAAMAAGSVLFVAGSAVLSLQPAERPLPELSFRTLEGRQVGLKDLAGKPLVVNLWATWCGPCVREMPLLQQAQRERGDVTFVFLNQGEDPAQVQAWLRQQGLQLDNVLADPVRQASAAFQQQGYPTTLFFDAGGRQVSHHLGALSAATLSDRLERATGRAGASSARP